jgi:hypothetical protein
MPDMHVTQDVEQDIVQAESLKEYPVEQTVQTVSDVQVAQSEEQGEHPPDESI